MSKQEKDTSLIMVFFFYYEGIPLNLLYLFYHHHKSAIRSRDFSKEANSSCYKGIEEQDEELTYGNIDVMNEGASGDSQGEIVPTFKVVLLGDSGVGKTCLRSQFVHHIFTNAYKATIGGDYLTATVRVTDSGPEQDGDGGRDGSARSADALGPPESKNVHLQIWDTAGQERFNSISQAFYRGTDVAVFVCDITNYESVVNLRAWFERFMEHCHVERPGVIVVANKKDRAGERSVELEEIKRILSSNNDGSVCVGDLIEDWDYDLQEVSSKSLDLVASVFVRVAEVALKISENTGGESSSTRVMQGFDTIDLSEAAKFHSPTRCMC
ncbi:Piso0_000194 [Millerozyma farinosa CBS 7064]|uniref:Piso0_000194 protein n=1 Tax=Pichia sorbitophila (strain ATCC MYA-4447 / BCRC 22081 / CBS 7064 / NBRC 10061 / NRRL Y-12695) TaxID=559304 RepID=G8YUS4_PICSO|nr:Piso0_000194 [Millerozyma farinosa CBS 7064]